MKKINLILVFILFTITASSQQWEYPEYGIIVNKQTSKITLLNQELGNTLELKADTVFIIKEGSLEFFIYKTGNLMGLIDPNDFEVSEKPKYTYFKILNYLDETILVKDKKHYSIVEGLVRKPMFKESYDTIYQIDSKGANQNLFMVSVGKKKGIINIMERVYFLPIEFDEINILELDYDRILTILKKGSKYGAADYKGLEVDVKYDEVKHIGGKYSDNLFLVKLKNKYGLVWQSELRYPVIFDKIAFVGKPWPYGYIIFESNGKFDVIEDTLPPFKPKYDKVWTEEKDGKVIINMQKEGKTTTIEQKI